MIILMRNQNYVDENILSIINVDQTFGQVSLT